MSNRLNLSLTNELRAFVDENCRDGMLYATPREFVRELLRQKKAQIEAEAARDRILEGFRDAIEGRNVEFRGDLKSIRAKAKK
jgi:Arc/MetJ-type ribon-helix-helix transcriptional regulator